MASKELLQILGKGVKSWNQWRRDNPKKRPDLRRADLHGADLAGADLAGADLHGADLSGANLSGANLSGTDLRDTNLRRAYLSGTNLSGTDLRGVDLRYVNLYGANLRGTDLRNVDLTGIDLRGTDLRGANLSGTNLSGTDLSGKDLRGANLSGVDLSDVVIFDADLSGTTFTNADLTRSRFIGCNLRDAVVENARVTDIDIQRLRGLPKPPTQLRIKGSDGDVLLIGFEAREFFHLPSIVEVYVTRELSQQELGCYHFHFGEMHHEGIATDVYFVGHRREHGGSVLRFQAKAYDTIYQVLPDLLAPFRTAEAIDWKQTIQSIPAEDRGEAITALATLEPRPPVVAWRFARRMAEIFDGYRNANVTHISEWGSRRLRIEIIENPEEVQRLSQMILPEPWDRQRSLIITQGSESNISITGIDMSNKAEVHGDAIGSAVGSGTVNARDITVYKNAIDNSSRLDHSIKQKLKEARDAIEHAELSDADKTDVLDELSKLTAELEKPEQDAGRVQRYWNRIKEVAPTVASILASAASMAKLLGGG